MTIARTLLTLVALGVALTATARAAQERVDAPLLLIWATHGHDQLLPHRIEELDANGNPTGKILDVCHETVLGDHLSPANGILPHAPFPANAELPNGMAGNHFLALRFSEQLDVDSVLDSAVSAQGSSNLTGAISVTAVDPISGATQLVRGRAFLGGLTYAGPPSGGHFPLQAWVVRQGGVVAPTAVDNDSDGVPEGLGFPGSEPGTSFAGDLDLVDRATFVFVADTDDDLTTHETFPAGFVLQLRANEAVADVFGHAPLYEIFVATEVGAALLSPEIAFVTPGEPCISPGDGTLDVDPSTEVRVCFTDDVQPLSVGPYAGSAPGLSAALELGFGAPNYPVPMAFTVRPQSVYDLSTWILTPAFPFPGSGGANGPVGNRVDVLLSPGGLRDLEDNVNLLGISTFFSTGAGAGIVNAPVAPDAIYLGFGTADRGLGVLDLNGFGASTGSPRYDPTHTAAVHADTNFPDNPNVKFQGSKFGLAPGTTTLDGGSAGVLTLARDSNLDTNLTAGGILLDVGDMALGHALDRAFNNAPAPFGCQAGGGNLCATAGLKNFSADQGGPNTLIPNFSGTGMHTVFGAENPISWAPHPNPPPIVFPPLCQVPLIPAAEPSSVDLLLGSPPVMNLLVPGDPFGDPSIGVPPTGLWSAEQNAFLVGPSPPSTQITDCFNFMISQQVGHFLYVVDRVRGEVVVFNSNRMTVVDRIAVEGATRMAMGTNLGLLAVTLREFDLVAFIDVNPSSGTFHKVVKLILVGDRPTGIAWEPGNEDILVCNSGDGSLSIVSAFSLSERKRVTNLLTHPIDVAITPRQDVFGHHRNAYFAYVIQRDGTLAIFESGPDGINGWGYDDVIGVAPFEFKNPKAIQPVPNDTRGAVAIAHEGPIDSSGNAGPFGTGAVSIVYVDSTVTGQQNLTAANFNTPQFRNMTIELEVSVGFPTLSGIPVDLAFDDLRNFGALSNKHTPFSAGAPVPMNGKGLVRDLGPAGVLEVSEPSLLFAAMPGALGGQVDVMRFDTTGLWRQDVDPFAAGAQSVPARAVRVLAHYFRQ